MQVVRCFRCRTLKRRVFVKFGETMVCVKPLICGGSGRKNGERPVSLEESWEDVKDVVVVGRGVLGEAYERWWGALPSAGSSWRLPPRPPASAAPGCEPWLQPPAPCQSLESHSGET